MRFLANSGKIYQKTCLTELMNFGVPVTSKLLKETILKDKNFF
jgi:hypothetical protein